MFHSLKLGFLGAGNLAQNLIQGYLEHTSLPPENIFISLRSRKKRFENKKISLLYNNEELLEKAQVIFLCVKVQDLKPLLKELQQSWQKKHSLFSPVAGIQLKKLKQWGLPSSRVIRFMPNTSVCVGKGLLPFYSLNNQKNLNSFAEEVLSPLGKAFALQQESQLAPLTVACASAPSFILEIMIYWWEWLSEQGFEESFAKELILQSFIGLGFMAEKRNFTSFEDLQKEICSKKGISEEGLSTLRKMELERILRLAFERSLLKLKEMEKI